MSVNSTPNTQDEQNIQKELTDEKRLWLGNLDPRINEYHLLKLLQKHGNIEKFDLLFHRTGSLAGQPRGYAFVTYSTKDEAVMAKAALHNKQIGQKNILVMWAHAMSPEEMEKPKPEINIPALAMSKIEQKTDKESQIQAIEAKLKLMEKKNMDELEINKTVATEPPVISQYQYNKQQSCSSSTRHKHNNVKKHDRYNSNKPYNKPRFRR